MKDYEIYMTWAGHLRDMVKVAGDVLVVLAALAAIGGTAWGAMALLLFAVVAAGGVTMLDERIRDAAEAALWEPLEVDK